MSDNCRQHYELATGKSLASPPKGPHPGYKKGGKVKMKPFGKGGKSMPRKASGRGC